MKEKVYVFGAYRALSKNHITAYGNFLHQYEQLPSIEQLINRIKKDIPSIENMVILSLQFLTKKQYESLKGSK